MENRNYLYKLIATTEQNDSLNKEIKNRIKQSENIIYKNKLIKADENNIHNLNIGHIYEYKIDRNNIGFCILLDDNIIENSFVFICPIKIICDEVDEREAKQHICYSLGCIPELTLEYEYVALLDEIKYVNESSLRLKDNYYKYYALAYLSNFKFLSLINEYKILLSRSLNANKKLTFVYKL